MPRRGVQQAISSEANWPLGAFDLTALVALRLVRPDWRCLVRRALGKLFLLIQHTTTLELWAKMRRSVDHWPLRGACMAACPTLPYFSSETLGTSTNGLDNPDPD